MRPREAADGLPDSLADLGRLARAGDPRALDLLLRRVQQPVYRYLVSRLLAAPDPEDLARDLCQEALIRAAGAIGRCAFASDGRLLAWLLTIARNVLLDHLRHARGRGEVRADAQWARVEAAGPIPGEEASPQRPLEAFAAEVLAQVPEPTAELLRLRLVSGWSWKDVAAALGIAETAAKRRFQRAQAAIRRQILARLGELPPEERRTAFPRLPAPEPVHRSAGAARRSLAEAGPPARSNRPRPAPRPPERPE